MDKIKHYFTKPHILALLGLVLVAGAFYLYSVLLVNSTPPGDSGSFDPIEAQSPETLKPQAEDEAQESVESNLETSGPQTYNLSEAGQITLLVNRSNLLPESYTPSGLQVPNIATEDKTQSELSVRPEVAAALEDMFTDAKQDGLNMLLASGYRSYATQSMLYNNAGGPGNTLVAPPGGSEHQTGLAADISGSNRACRLETCFGNDPEGKWLAANAHNYGFIIRYPADRTADTGYSYEPWHLRYVGEVLAQRIHEDNLILEDV